MSEPIVYTKKFNQASWLALIVGMLAIVFQGFTLYHFFGGWALTFGAFMAVLSVFAMINVFRILSYKDYINSKGIPNE